MYIDLSRSRAAAAVNSTLEESTAYPSLVGCGPGCGVILYDLTATGTGVFNQTTKRFGFSIPRHGMIRPSRELHFPEFALSIGAHHQDSTPGNI